MSFLGGVLYLCKMKSFKNVIHTYKLFASAVVMLIAAGALSSVAVGRTPVPARKTRPAAADSSFYAYCDVSGFNRFGKTEAVIDLGDTLSQLGGTQSLYDGHGKKIKFNTIIDVVNYMGQRGWRMFSVYQKTEKDPLEHTYYTIHYLMEKCVKNRDEIKEGLILGKDF